MTTTYTITPGAREALDVCYAVLLQAAARRRARLARENGKAASDQVDRPGTLTAAVTPSQGEDHPHSTPQ